MRSRATRVVAACLLAVILTVLAGLAVFTDAGGQAGPILLRITTSHGVHERDIPVVGAWLVGLVCCVLLGRR